MRFVLAFVWATILMNMAYYVLGSMSGVAYNFQTATIIGLVVGAFVILIGELIPSDDVEHSH